MHSSLRLHCPTGTLALSLLLGITACRPSAGVDSTPSAPLVERPAPGEVRAGRITEHAERLMGGAAEATIGDWKLMNHEAIFTVHDVGESVVYIMNGGALIDADLWREGDSWDLVYNYAPMIGSVYQFEAERITLLSDGSGPAKQAVLRVEGYFRAADVLGGIFGFDLNPYKDNVTGITDYRLKPDTRALEIETFVYNISKTPQKILGGDGLIPSDHYGDPFVAGGGFARNRMHGYTDLIGGLGERNEGFFGLMPAAEAEYELPVISTLIPMKDMTIFLANQTVCELEPGESCSWRRYAVIAESPARARTAALSIQKRAAATVSGQVTGQPSGKSVAGARVFLTPSDQPDHVIDLDITDARGQFYLHPQGYTHVTVWAQATDRGETAVHPAALPPVAQAEGYLHAAPVTISTLEPIAPLALSMTEPALVTLRVKDSRSGKKLPGKFTFALPAGMIAPELPEAFGEAQPYSQLNPSPIPKVVWQAHADDITIAIAPGEYEVFASFGMEYELGRLENTVVLAAGGKYELDFSLRRSVDLTGWAQCDTHLHTSYSNHGRTSHSDRVITIVAEGLNCGAITDHDRIYDFQPLVRALGLTDRLLTFPAIEVSTFLRGHINPYPIYPLLDDAAPDSDLPIEGAVNAIPWWQEAWTIPRLFKQMRDLGAAIIQINHGSGVGGYFTMTGYDPKTGTGDAEYSSRFDVFELSNGQGLGGVPDLREIAFSLWDRGQRKTAVGVSDSHRRIPEPGYSRTLVRVPTHWHANMHEDLPVAGLLAMNAVVSNGVFVDMTVGGAEYGATVTGANLIASIRVEAASWVPLQEAKLYYNGTTIEAFPITETNGGVRLQVEYVVPATVDGWLALEVVGPAGATMWPVVPRGKPYALTNPIFVDVDGDGWTPPRTPVPDGALSDQYDAPAEIPLDGHSHGGGHHHH